MIRVNLLTSAPGSPRRDWLPAEQRSAAVGLTMLLVTGLGVGAWWWELRRESQTVEATIATAQADLNRLKDVAKIVDLASARKADLTERLALISRLRADQRGPVSLLETISRSLPDGLWLIELNQKGTGVQIEGRASSLTAITDFVEHLQDSGLFQRPVEIVTTSIEAVEDASVVRFIVKAEAPAPPAPAVQPPAKAGVTKSGAPDSRPEA